MTNYEKVFEEAIGNYGLITSAQAVGIGISNKELVKLAARGRLTRIGQGTYKLVQYAPAPNGLDAYADSVAIVGEGAYLYGESVLALCGLCPVDPSRIFVATDRRVRKNPVPGLVIVDRRPKSKLHGTRESGVSRLPMQLGPVRAVSCQIALPQLPSRPSGRGCCPRIREMQFWRN